MNLARSIVAVGAVALFAGSLIFTLSKRRHASVEADPSAPAASLPAVAVVPVETHTMSRSLRLSGTLQSGSEAMLSPKQGGKVLAVYAREGQAVHRGDLLVGFDQSDARRQVEQAAAARDAARANWNKAVRGAALKRVDVQRRIDEAKRGVEQAKLQVEKAEAGTRLQGRATKADVERAQAGVDAARSALAQARRGARPEQRRLAEIQLQQAERGSALAKKNLSELELLFGKGGVPRVQVDEARESYQKAADGVAQARAQLDLLNAGASAEEIAAAEAQVRSAEAGLTAARAAGGREDVDRLDIAAARAQQAQAEDGLRSAEASRSEIELAEQDVRAARAGYSQAVSGWQLASQQIRDASILSPLDGVVSSVAVHVGEVAGPGRPIVTVQGTAGVYLDAAVPARVLSQVRVGLEARISLDALPGREFSGTVQSVGGQAGADGRSFPVHIDINAPAGVLKPGAFARADLVSETYANALTVPVEAVRNGAHASSVWVVRAGKVAEVPVEVPLQDEHRAMVRGALRAGDAVIAAPAPGLSSGDAVRVLGPGTKGSR